MKIAIIGYSAKKISPYLQFYINHLRSQGVVFDYYTREISEEFLDTDLEDNQYRIICKGTSRISKIFNLLKWRYSIIRSLKKNEYDRLIILTVYPAIILKDFLCNHYNKRFILDIRDYAEILNNKILYRRLKSVQYSCSFTVVSSDGFRDWLPVKKDTYTLHNCPTGITSVSFSNISLLEHLENPTLGYLGVMAYPEQNLALIKDSVSKCYLNLYYAGVYDDKRSLQQYAEKNSVLNVKFDGPFDNSSKKELYKTIDLINAVYGCSSIVVTSALPNKLYDAMIYGKPIVVSKGTFLCKVVERYNLGIGVDFMQNPISCIREYVDNFSKEKFVKGCNLYLAKCITENSATIDVINKFIKDESKH